MEMTRTVNRSHNRERFRIVREYECSTSYVHAINETPRFPFREGDSVELTREEVFTIWKQSPDNSESRLICEKFLRLLI